MTHSTAEEDVSQQLLGLLSREMVRNTSILAEQLSTDAPVFVEAEHLAPEIVTAWPQLPMSARIIAYLYAVTLASECEAREDRRF